MTDKQFKNYVIALLSVIFIILSATLPIFSVYLNGGTYGEPKVSGRGVYQAKYGLVINEDAEICNQTLLQVIYRLITDGSREESARVKRIGITL